MNFLRVVLRATFEWTVRHPILMLGVVLFALSISLWRLPQSKVELQIYDIDDPAFESTRDLRELRRMFGSGHPLMMIFHRQGAEQLSQGDACAIADWVTKQRRDNPEVTSMLFPLGLRKPNYDGERLLFPRIFEDILAACEQEGYSARQPLPMERLQGSPWVGLSTDEHFKDLGIEISLRDTVAGSRLGSFDPEPVGEIWRSAQALCARYPGLKVELTGQTAFLWHYKRILRSDSVYNALILLVLLVFFRVFFGSWKSGALLCALLLASGLIVFGTMALLGVPIDVLANSLFMMMCVAGLQDYAFLSQQRMHNRSASKDAWKNDFRVLLLPGFLTSLTTIIGFGSLALSELSIIRRFGTWAAFAAFVEWVLTFLALPAMLALWPRLRQWTNYRKAYFPWPLPALASWGPGKRTLSLALVLLLPSLYAFSHLNFDDDPTAILPQRHVHTEAYDYLRATRGWEANFAVVFPKEVSDEERRGLLQSMAALSNVSRVDDFSKVSDYLAAGLPDPVSSMVRRELRETPAADRYASPTGEMRAFVFLKHYQSTILNQTLAGVRQLCGNRCWPVGEGVVYAEYTTKVVDTLFESLSLSIALVSGVLLLLLRRRSWLEKIAVLLSALWGPVLAVGLAAFTQVSINIVNCMVASILVGLTGDNAIQFVLAARRKSLSHGVTRRGPASLMVSVMTISGSAMLLLLSTVPVRVLGVLLVVGFILAYVGDVWILQGLLARATTKQHRGGAHGKQKDRN